MCLPLLSVFGSPAVSSGYIGKRPFFLLGFAPPPHKTGLPFSRSYQMVEASTGSCQGLVFKGFAPPTERRVGGLPRCLYSLSCRQGPFSETRGYKVPPQPGPKPSCAAICPSAPVHRAEDGTIRNESLLQGVASRNALAPPRTSQGPWPRSSCFACHALAGPRPRALSQLQLSRTRSNTRVCSLTAVLSSSLL